jgi:hypothetical protein
MNHESIHPRGALPLDVLDRIDLACDRFEAAWSTGQRPRIEDCLDPIRDRYDTLTTCELLTCRTPGKLT